MNIKDLQVGMKIDMHHARRYSFVEWGRVEHVAYDWAVVRADDDRLHLLEQDDAPFNLYIVEKVI